MDLSVIIPTYNRSVLLERVLLGYSQQTWSPERFEVIVVDDGSADDCSTLLEGLAARVPYRLVRFAQRHSGPAAARNRGVRAARGRFLLFTNDDMLPAPDLVERHPEILHQHPESAVLGFVEWSPELKLTDFMSYLAPYGPQFDYTKPEHLESCGVGSFCTANISLAKSWFDADGFDEGFPHPVMEDVEIGYRFEKKGLKIRFNRTAVAFHHHEMTTHSFCARMWRAGVSANRLFHKHPELESRLVPTRMRLLRRYPRLLKLLLVFRSASCRLYWRSMILGAYFEGMRFGKDLT